MLALAVQFIRSNLHKVPVRMGIKLLQLNVETITLQRERRRELRAFSRKAFNATWQRDGIGVSVQFEAVNTSYSGYAFQSPSEVPVGTVVYLQACGVSTIGCGLVRYCHREANGFLIGMELDEATKATATHSELSATNYYEFLQISRNAQSETIQRVYRFLAARYHPDNSETGDPEKFLYLNRAYQVLCDPARRSSYDQELRRSTDEDQSTDFAGVDFLDGIDGELNRRLGVLAVLYRRCRTNINEPRVSLIELEKLMGFPREYLDFTTWYLKNKGYLKKEDNSDFALTVSGVDFVEENYEKFPLLSKLLSTGRSADFSASAWNDSVRSDRDNTMHFLIQAANNNGLVSERSEERLGQK